jgi:hypothetical protein
VVGDFVGSFVGGGMHVTSNPPQGSTPFHVCVT